MTSETSARETLAAAATSSMVGCADRALTTGERLRLTAMGG
jgi:type IV pilus biogenesis protein CpaD/CtpE